MQISYHFALTKIQKLQNLNKKKKKLFFCISRYCLKLVGTAGIFFCTKQGGYMYRFACRYGIYRPYRPVQYEIDSLVINWNTQHCGQITLGYLLVIAQRQRKKLEDMSKVLYASAVGCLIYVMVCNRYEHIEHFFQLPSSI